MRLRREPDVEVARHGMVGVGLRDAEVVPLPVLAALRFSLEQRPVEAATRFEVGDADRDVVEHQTRSMASPKE
jgi:hypothetical protein